MISTMHENNLESIYHITPCYFFSFSETGILTRINNTFLNQLGYTSEEIIAVKKFTDILTIGSKIFFETHFFPLIKLHGKFDEIFLSFLSRKKEEIPVLLNVIRIGSAEKYEIHCGGMQIPQRNRFEKELLGAKHVAEKALLENEALTQVKQQLEDNQKMLESRLQELSQRNHEHQQINTVISHDLQEPLRKVSLFSNKLLTENSLALDDSTLTYLQKINVASERMRSLVINMQKFLSLNEYPLSLSKIDLNKIFEEAIDKNSIDKKDSSIRFFITSMPEIKADQHLIVNLFCQLVSNSLKYRDPNKPSLDIHLHSERVEQNIFKALEHKYKYEEFIRITYTDNGVGFENSFSTKVFELFRKAHDVKEGLGIGLAYCKKILELHRGFISVSSKPDEGTSFTILLPAVPAE